MPVLKKDMSHFVLAFRLDMLRAVPYLQPYTSGLAALPTIPTLAILAGII